MSNKAIALCAGAALLAAACDESATAPQALDADVHAAMALGNGFPQGGHDYKMNIIGVPMDKTATMDGNNGHRIFVQLDSDNEVTNPGGKNNHLKKGGNNDQNHIYLCNSTDGENDVNDDRCDEWRASHAGEFGVIDANATDGDGAIFGLPDPCADADPTTDCEPIYAVWARAHGPGGDATITTCGDEAADGFDETDDVWCGNNGITLDPKGNAKKAIDVSGSLLYMTILVDPDLDPELSACLGVEDTDAEQDEVSHDIYLFDNCFEDYFWNYNNNGLKLLELRFYAN